MEPAVLEPGGGAMKKSLLLLFLLTIGGGLNTVEAQSMPVRVGYAALSAAFSPVWMAKELDLFERQGIQSTPIYMAATIAWSAMLAGRPTLRLEPVLHPFELALAGLIRSYYSPISVGSTFPSSPARRFINLATSEASALESTDLERARTSVHGLP